MTEDEKEIRELPVKWMAATRAGDVDALLDLMTGDALFLTPGNAPMDRTLFKRIATEKSGEGMPEFDAESEVREIQVLGDHAFMWTKLRVTVTPHDGGPVARSGHTMTILRKESGKWRLARDANLLAVESDAVASHSSEETSVPMERAGIPDPDPNGLLDGFPTLPIWYIWQINDSGSIVDFPARCDSREAAEARLEELREKKPGEIFQVQEARSIVPDRTLPDPGQIRQICGLLHHALVTLRSMGYKKDPDAVAEFADMIENIPTEMFDERHWDWNMLEYSFMSFEKRNPGKSIFPYADMIREIRYGSPQRERMPS